MSHKPGRHLTDAELSRLTIARLKLLQRKVTQQVRTLKYGPCADVLSYRVMLEPVPDYFQQDKNVIKLFTREEYLSRINRELRSR
jgi:hypothetical protein